MADSDKDSRGTNDLSQPFVGGEGGEAASVVTSATMTTITPTPMGHTSPPPPPSIPPGAGGLIRNPTPSDVLCGRGGRINNHDGNLRFRELVQENKHVYLAKNTKKLDKAHIAANIVQTIRDLDPMGRFLKVDEGSGLWVEIGDEKARKKAGQALREDAPEVRHEIAHQETEEQQERMRAWMDSRMAPHHGYGGRGAPGYPPPPNNYHHGLTPPHHHPTFPGHHPSMYHPNMPYYPPHHNPNVPSPHYGHNYGGPHATPPPPRPGYYPYQHHQQQHQRPHPPQPPRPSSSGHQNMPPPPNVVRGAGRPTSPKNNAFASISENAANDDEVEKKAERSVGTSISSLDEDTIKKLLSASDSDTLKSNLSVISLLISNPKLGETLFGNSTSVKSSLSISSKELKQQDSNRSFSSNDQDMLLELLKEVSDKNLGGKKAESEKDSGGENNKSAKPSSGKRQSSFTEASTINTSSLFGSPKATTSYAFGTTAALTNPTTAPGSVTVANSDNPLARMSTAPSSTLTSRVDTKRYRSTNDDDDDDETMDDDDDGNTIDVDSDDDDSGGGERRAANPRMSWVGEMPNMNSSSSNRNGYQQGGKLSDSQTTIQQSGGNGGPLSNANWNSGRKADDSWIGKKNTANDDDADGKKDEEGEGDNPNTMKPIFHPPNPPGQMFVPPPPPPPKPPAPNRALWQKEMTKVKQWRMKKNSIINSQMNLSGHSDDQDASPLSSSAASAQPQRPRQIFVKPRGAGGSVGSAAPAETSLSRVREDCDAASAESGGGYPNDTDAMSLKSMDTFNTGEMNDLMSLTSQSVNNLLRARGSIAGGGESVGGGASLLTDASASRASGRFRMTTKNRSARGDSTVGSGMDMESLESGASWLKSYENMQSVGSGINPWMNESARSIISDLSNDLLSLDLQEQWQQQQKEYTEALRQHQEYLAQVQQQQQQQPQPQQQQPEQQKQPQPQSQPQQQQPEQQQKPQPQSQPLVPDQSSESTSPPEEPPTGKLQAQPQSQQQDEQLDEESQLEPLPLSLDQESL